MVLKLKRKDIFVKRHKRYFFYMIYGTLWFFILLEPSHSQTPHIEYDMWRFFRLTKGVGLVDWSLLPSSLPPSETVETANVWDCDIKGGEVVGRQIGWMRNGEMVERADPALSRLPPSLPPSDCIAWSPRHYHTGPRSSSLYTYVYICFHTFT